MLSNVDHRDTNSTLRRPGMLRDDCEIELYLSVRALFRTMECVLRNHLKTLVPTLCVGTHAPATLRPLYAYRRFRIIS
jgi:hypothetical protein